MMYQTPKNVNLHIKTYILSIYLHLTITIFSKSWNKNVPVLIKID